VESALDRRLLNHAKSAGLFPKPGVALVAVSGGYDSVALLDLMSCVSEELHLQLAIAHVIHGISAEATDFVPRIEQISRDYDLPLFKKELGLGPAASETLARQERYGALREIQEQEGATYLLTAHHIDDQVETVLLRFLRGTGLSGLAGIPALGPNGLVRPLLQFSREELEGWIVSRFPDPGLRPPIFNDPANADERHDRSWVRHCLIPLLRDRFGEQIGSRILDVAEHAQCDNLAWKALLSALPGLQIGVCSGRFEVARESLGRYDKLLSERILRAAAREAGCLLRRDQAAALLKFSVSASSGRTMELGGGWDARLEFDRLVVSRTADVEAPKGCQVDLRDGAEDRLSWGSWEFSWSTEAARTPLRDSNTTWITYGELEFRSPRSGDTVLPLGGIGTRKVRKVLAEARVPATDRDYFPVIARGEDVLWLPGICRSSLAIPREGEPAVRMDARAL